MAGAGGVAQIGNLGVVNFAAAVTGGGGQACALVAAGAQRIGRKFSLGASAIFATHSYRGLRYGKRRGSSQRSDSAVSRSVFPAALRFGRGGLCRSGSEMPDGA